MAGGNRKVKLSVIIPAYNEKETILQVIRRVQEANIGVEKQIIAVDDGSTDGTRDLLAAISDENVEVYFHEKNQGKGAAVRTGLSKIKGDLVVIQDADLEYDPEDYPILMKPILNGQADVVYGSRFLGPHRAFLFLHFLGNKFLTLVTNALYDTILTDMETCYKMFRADVFSDITIRSNKFDFEPEITAKVLKRGYRLFEVPITYSGRDFEEGKKIHPWRDGLHAFWALFKFRFVE